MKKCVIVFSIILIRLVIVVTLSRKDVDEKVESDGIKKRKIEDTERRLIINIRKQQLKLLRF